MSVEQFVSDAFGIAFLLAYVVFMARLVVRWRGSAVRPEWAAWVGSTGPEAPPPSKVAKPPAMARIHVRPAFDPVLQTRGFAALQRHLSTRYRTTFDLPDDGATYRIRHLALLDENADRVSPSEGARARYLVGYLERADEPTRLQVTLDIESGAVSEMEANAVAWRAIPPPD